MMVIALFCTLLAAACLALAFRRGGVVLRCYCIVLLLPSLFVFWDFARRAPAVFRSR